MNKTTALAIGGTGLVGLVISGCATGQHEVNIHKFPLEPSYTQEQKADEEFLSRIRQSREETLASIQRNLRQRNNQNPQAVLEQTTQAHAQQLESVIQFNDQYFRKSLIPNQGEGAVIMGNVNLSADGGMTNGDAYWMNLGNPLMSQRVSDASRLVDRIVDNPTKMSHYDLKQLNLNVPTILNIKGTQETANMDVEVTVKKFPNDTRVIYTIDPNAKTAQFDISTEDYKAMVDIGLRAPLIAGAAVTGWHLAAGAALDVALDAAVPALAIGAGFQLLSYIVDAGVNHVTDTRQVYHTQDTMPLLLNPPEDKKDSAVYGAFNTTWNRFMGPDTRNLLVVQYQDGTDIGNVVVQYRPGNLSGLYPHSVTSDGGKLNVVFSNKAPSNYWAGMFIDTAKAGAFGYLLGLTDYPKVDDDKKGKNKPTSPGGDPPGGGGGPPNYPPEDPPTGSPGSGGGGAGGYPPETGSLDYNSINPNIKNPFSPIYNSEDLGIKPLQPAMLASAEGINIARPRLDTRLKENIQYKDPSLTRDIGPQQGFYRGNMRQRG
ncbi:hypothetical protein K9M79_01295 [Candidatus Woesearchaeota archaeon]|nr:hypothetical protein [Candidatus Woesearchaeota archaeon]